jgi:hypothetical protein
MGILMLFVMDLLLLVGVLGLSALVQTGPRDRPQS